MALWAGPGSAPERRSALVRAGDEWHRLVTRPDSPELSVREVGDYLYEPVGAVIRSGGIAELGRRLEAGLLDPHLAYLTGDRAVPTPYATAYAVRGRLPYDVRALRRWVADRQVGRLEIKQRGTTVDPAKLRRELRPAGPNAATLIVSRTPRGTVVLVAERVDG